MRPSLFVQYCQIIYSLRVVGQFLFKCGFHGNKNCTKSAISQFATFTQLQSLKKLHALHFSIFPLEILNIASQLNLAANYYLRFLNFDFGAILTPFWRNYSTRENLKSRYPKIAFICLLEKTTHPKLGLYLPRVNIYRFDEGI